MPINLLLILPIIFCLILFLLKKEKLNNFFTVVYAIMHSAVSFYYLFDEQARFTDKYFHADNSNIIFLIVLSVIFLAVSIYNKGYLNISDTPVKRKRHYTYMLLIFVQAMTGVIVSNNIGISWVLVEATTLASAYLIYFSRTKHSIEAAWKYVFMCSIGIALAFVGIILLTIATGELNSLCFTDLLNNAQTFDKFWLKLSFVFILFGFGTKMGVAPLHFWLPDAHSEAPSPISALLSAALLNSAYLVILNVYFILMSADCNNYARITMLVTGFLSLFIAAVFIYKINNYKRMLAYSSVENMGILFIGTAIGGAGLFAAMIHLVGHSLCKASFFLTSGNILEIYKTKKINKIKGLINVDKVSGWLFILSFLGIAAFPPSILFVSEFLIIKTMLVQERYFLTVLMFILLCIILYGMGKVVINIAYGEVPEEKLNELKQESSKLTIGMYLPQIVLISTAFVLGMYLPHRFIELTGFSIQGFWL